ncbi:Beta-parvin, partial [Stegodyphus mimosarum]
MALPRPKSPRPVTPQKKKDESFFEYLGTLGRRKKIKEVNELTAEGKNAIDSPGSPALP